MSRDPRTYQNPEIFDPYRILRNQPERDPRSHIFGFGRRICAGNYRS
jgi:cytochrome P450